MVCSGEKKTRRPTRRTKAPTSRSGSWPSFSQVAGHLLRVGLLLRGVLLGQVPGAHQFFVYDAFTELFIALCIIVNMLMNEEMNRTLKMGNYVRSPRPTIRSPSAPYSSSNKNEMEHFPFHNRLLDAPRARPQRRYGFDQHWLIIHNSYDYRIVHLHTAIRRLNFLVAIQV